MNPIGYGVLKRVRAHYWALCLLATSLEFSCSRAEGYGSSVVSDRKIVLGYQQAIVDWTSLSQEPLDDST